MEAIFQRIDKRIEPHQDTKVLKPSDRVNYVQASQLIEQAEAKAAQIIQDAEKIYEQRKVEGYKDGLSEVQMEHVEKIMETVISSVTFIENIESTLVDVVVSSIRKVMNSCSKEELAEQVVHKALNNIRSNQKALLRVCPEDEKTVKTFLANMLTGDGSGFIDVISDPRLERTSCILESELGVVDASLDVQLQALEHAFKAKINK